ncbi:hypothetical protein RIR_jg4918.t1 [Rhizophagus irregularis DAOM 181602=DAOM 197198]|nr:hypothetical protein RIR_jg4918.t1 [Rhizophagus irregularis DAOM 181602=DAOM 197198]
MGHVRGNVDYAGRRKRREFSVSRVASFTIGFEVGPKSFDSRRRSRSIKAKGGRLYSSELEGECWESSREVPEAGAEGDTLVLTGGEKKLKHYPEEEELKYCLGP